MNAIQDVGPSAQVAAAHKLLAEVLQGAEANDRPDLIARLRAAQAALVDPMILRRHAATAPGHTGNTGVAGNSDVVRAAAAQVLRAADSLAADLKVRRATLTDPVRAARLSAELADVKARHDRFTAASREWQYVLSDGFAGVNSDLEFYLRARIREIRTEAELAIAGGKLSSDGAPSPAWLNQRLATEADLVYRRLRDGAGRVAVQVATHLRLPAVHRLPAAAATRPDRLVAALPTRLSVPRGRAPLPARLLTVFMPSYGGVMMTLILSRFLGLALPGWLIAVCAATGALLLGGAAFTGDRSRQQELLRAEATTHLRTTLEEFQLALGKQARDAARVLQQDLRRATADVVTGMGNGLTAELATARAAADTTRRVSTELAHITSDLEALAGLRKRASALLKPASAGSAGSSAGPASSSTGPASSSTGPAGSSTGPAGPGARPTKLALVTG